jgi:hypothetical protein
MGHLNTERANAHFASLPPQQRSSITQESPQFTGRVIAVLYAQDDMMSYSGRAMIGAELGARLGVTDIDGTIPPSLRDELGAPPELHHTLR